jgi:hypothetical protein
MFILIIVAVAAYALARYAAARHEHNIARGRRTQAPLNKTGADIAAEFLAVHEVTDVQILRHNSVVSDYFDPARRRLFLRAENYDGKDLAAWAIALHEAAHALQRGEDESALRWRRTCISFTRYVPTAAAFGAVALTLFLKRPARISLMMFAGVCALVLLLNIGTLAVEFNANKRLFNWLDDRLERDPESLSKLHEILGSVAIREVGDILSSPRYFFLSALPGTSSARPIKKDGREAK